MDYIEVNIGNFSGFEPEIVIAQLADMGFESFTESGSGIQGYISEDMFDEETFNSYLQGLHDAHGLLGSVKKIPAQNWNAIWESSYEPVVIEGKCRVRAPFHDPLPGMLYEIVIEPRMSFGTAHHETTSMMLGLLMTEDVRGKRVLDMGCGTGVLAVLAHKMLADQVIAIDNDEWACENAHDNMEMNDAIGVNVIRGEATDIPLPAYDLILANINRNVLLHDIPVYADFLQKSGVLLMSGFYEEDLEQIVRTSEQAGLQYVHHRTENKWVGVKFVKLPC